MTISTTKIPIQEIASGADGMVDVADTSSTEALSRLDALRVARAAMMKREIQRLEATGTDRTHRVQILTSRLSNDIDLAGEARFAAMRMGLDAPASEPNSWALYGVVLAGAGKPAANHRLVVSDQRSGAQLGEAFIDTKGRFSLKLDAEQSDVDPATGVAAQLARLQVFNPEGSLVHSQDQAAEITAGNVEYRELMLAKTTEPAATRKKTPKKKAVRKKAKKKR